MEWSREMTEVTMNYKCKGRKVRQVTISSVFVLSYLVNGDKKKNTKRTA
jgi:hypothetical protein